MILTVLLITHVKSDVTKQAVLTGVVSENSAGRLLN